MRWLIFGIFAAATLGCSVQVPQSQHNVVEMPSIAADVKPNNGSIVEYWPNGKTRSERVYVSGHVQEAVYYASDGTVIFEMSEDSPTAPKAGR